VESSIISRNDWKQIKDWLPVKNPRSKLLYRATRDGFESANFHKRCDNIPGTVVIAKTSFDKVIGAYTPISWN
jgi:hypothetical protein